MFTDNFRHVFFLQLEYFETILNPYFTSDARESLKSLQGVLLEKATESVSESVENPGHHRRPTRGSEDALGDERQQGMTVSPDDLIVRIYPFSMQTRILLFHYYVWGPEHLISIIASIHTAEPVEKGFYYYSYYLSIVYNVIFGFCITNYLNMFLASFRL